MSDDLYILAATATKRNGLVVERNIILEFILADSKEQAIKQGGRHILERRFPPAVWCDPILRTESIPLPRIQWYRKELRVRDDSLTRLTFLWAYAIFYHESSSLECGTVIAQTKQAAEEGIMRGPGKYTRGRKDFSVEKIPSRLILPRPSGHEDPAETLRKKFALMTDK